MIRPVPLSFMRQGGRATESEQKLFAIPPKRDEPDPAEIAARRGELPLPNDIRSFMLTGIFTLLVFYTLYVGREIFLPIMFAVVLKLLLMPPMRVLSGCACRRCWRRCC